MLGHTTTMQISRVWRENKASWNLLTFKEHSYHFKQCQIVISQRRVGPSHCKISHRCIIMTQFKCPSQKCLPLIVVIICCLQASISILLSERWLFNCQWLYNVAFNIYHLCLLTDAMKITLELGIYINKIVYICGFVQNVLLTRTSWYLIVVAPCSIRLTDGWRQFFTGQSVPVVTKIGNSCSDRVVSC